MNIVSCVVLLRFSVYFINYFSHMYIVHICMVCIDYCTSEFLSHCMVTFRTEKMYLCIYVGHLDCMGLVVMVSWLFVYIGCCKLNTDVYRHV